MEKQCRFRRVDLATQAVDQKRPRSSSRLSNSQESTRRRRCERSSGWPRLENRRVRALRLQSQSSIAPLGSHAKQSRHKTKAQTSSTPSLTTRSHPKSGKSATAPMADRSAECVDRATSIEAV